MAKNTTLKAGTNAYYDSFAGLVPCRVLRVSTQDLDGIISVRVVDARVMRDHGPYRKGDAITTSVRYMVPTGSVRRRKYGTAILPYSIELD